MRTERLTQLSNVQPFCVKRCSQRHQVSIGNFSPESYFARSTPSGKFILDLCGKLIIDLCGKFIFICAVSIFLICAVIPIRGVYCLNGDVISSYNNGAEFTRLIIFLLRCRHSPTHSANYTADGHSNARFKAHTCTIKQIAGSLVGDRYHSIFTGIQLNSEDIHVAMA